jgi:hypothetical protein
VDVVVADGWGYPQMVHGKTEPFTIRVYHPGFSSGPLIFSAFMAADLGVVPIIV